MTDNYINLNVEHYLRNGVLKGIHKDLNSYCGFTEKEYKPLTELVPLIKKNYYYYVSENLKLTKLDSYNRAVIRIEDLNGRTLEEWLKEKLRYVPAFMSLEIWRNDLGNFGAWMPLFKSFSGNCETQFVTDNNNKGREIGKPYSITTYKVEDLEAILGNIRGESEDIYIGKYNFDYANGRVKLRVATELELF